MYRLNELKRPVLITVDEVVARAAIASTPDVRMLLQNIEIAEERFIAPALGDAFYEDFVSKKNVVITQSNQTDLLVKVNYARSLQGQTALSTTDLRLGSMLNAIELVQNAYYVALWNRFLWRITAEAVDLMATVPSWLQHTAQGQMLNNPAIIGSGATSASGSAKDVRFKLDVQMEQRIDPMMARMHEWLQAYRLRAPTAFPLYTRRPADEDNGVSITRKSGFVFSAYDDDHDDYCSRKANTVLPVPTPAPPTPAPMRRMQFITDPGQTVYPAVGQIDEAEVREELKGSTLISFTVEGIEMFEGTGPGEMEGLDPIAGEVRWNEASDNALRCILKYEKL